MTLWEILNDMLSYWRIASSPYSYRETWRQKEFSKLVSADKNGQSYY